MKKLSKRLLSVLLVFCIAVSMTAVAMVPAQAGLIANALSGNFSDIAVGAVERVVTTAVAIAADKAEDETVAEVLSWTNRILSGYQSVVNKTLIEETEAISQQLDEMYTAMTTEFDSVHDKLNQVIENQEKDRLLDSRDNVHNRAYYYEAIVKDFDELLSAFVEYNKAENPSKEDEVYINLDKAYRNVYQKYSYTFDKTMLDTREVEMFVSPLFPDQNGNSGLFGIISPNDHTEDITYDEDGNPVLADVSTWGDADPYHETYLDLMRAYAETVYNFESNVYQLMVAGANEVGNTVSMYVTAYSYYVDFNTMLINSDETLTAKQKSDAIADLNSNFEEYTYKLIRAINQMLEDNKDVYTTYMRPYDTTATVTMNDYVTEQKLADAYAEYDGVNLPSDKEDADMGLPQLDYHGPDVEVHQFKLVNESGNTTYAIKTNTVYYPVEYAAFPYENDCVVFSLSMLNFLKGTANGLKTIEASTDLSNITGNNNSYVNSDTLVNNIKRELGYSSSSVKLDSVGAADVNDAPKAYMLLDSEITWDGDNLIFDEEAANMTWLDVSKTTPKNVEVDAKDDARNGPAQATNLYVMYKGSPTVSLDVNAVSSDSVANGVGEVYIDGNCVISNNGSATGLKSSKPLTLKVTPDDDAFVSSIVLKNSDGDIIGTLYSGTQEDYATVADKNGIMKLSAPVPCQDTVIEVTYSNIIDEYTVNLSSVDADTTVLFEDGTEDQKIVNEGETVKFNVLPDEGYVVIGAKVNDENGNAISTSATDISSVTGVEGAKQYSFTMPESNVDVIAGSYLELGYDFIIYDYEDLCEMRDNINAGAVLTVGNRQIAANEGRYILANDIICPEGGNWSSVVVDGGFSGNLDGRGYAIKNLTVTDTSLEKVALFESIGENGTVKNLTLENLYLETGSNGTAGGIAVENNGYITNCHISGLIKTNEDIPFSEENIVIIGSIAAENAGKITDCTSSCNIYADDGITSAMVGGITGFNTVLGEVKGSSNSGNIEAYAIMNILGGISGTSAGIQQTSYNEGNIVTHGWINAGGIAGYAYKGLFSDESIVKTLNCYNLGDITVKEYTTNDTVAQDYYDLYIEQEGETIHVGGVFGNIVNTSASGLYNAGNITKYGESLYGIIGEEGSSVTVDNYYYLVADTADVTDETQKYESQFESGEVAYLLNGEVTDGTQVWYQNIDNGEPIDKHPVFEGGTVYKNTTCKGNISYSNYDEGVVHNYNNYHVCKDCIGLRPGEAAGIYGFSIGLGGNISVNYYMVLDEDVAADETAKMVFTVPDTGSSYKVEIPVSEATFDGVFHHFTCEVAAKEISSDIYCRIVTDTRESDNFRYSVKEYAEVILANPNTYEKEIPLVKAMLNYGGYAQISFGYNTDNLANTSENITEEEKLLPEVDFSSYAHTTEGEEAGVTYYGSAISLKSETAIKHYFYFENEENIPTITVNGEEVTPVKNGGYYEVKVSDIPAHKLHETYEVKIGGFTLNYGVFSYCYAASSKATDQSLIDVANALHAYNQAAINYIGK